MEIPSDLLSLKTSMDDRSPELARDERGRDDWNMLSGRAKSQTVAALTTIVIALSLSASTASRRLPVEREDLLASGVARDDRFVVRGEGK